MKTFEIAKGYLNKKVKVTVDRSLNSKHPKHGFKYEVNYGFIEGVKASDGEDLDAYIIGVDEPVDSFEGEVIAIIHREDDDDDKLIVAPKGFEISDEEILDKVKFQEQWFRSSVYRG